MAQKLWAMSVEVPPTGTPQVSLIHRFWTSILVYAVKFGVVGILGVFVDTALFNLLRLGAFGTEGWWATALGAKVISTSVAIIFNWLGNRFWTFRHERHTHILREFIEFVIASMVGMVIALGCLWISHHVFGLIDIVSDNISANVIGLGLGTLARFVLYRYWVWSPRRAQGGPHIENLDTAVVTLHGLK
jgi:putative flippase GtrA